MQGALYVVCQVWFEAWTIVNNGRELSSAPTVIIGGGGLTHDCREVSLAGQWTYKSVQHNLACIACVHAKDILRINPNVSGLEH